MGWDIKATADTVAQAIPSLPTLPSDFSLSQAAHWVLMGFLVLAVAAALMRLVPRLWKIIEEIFLHNWRLALLGSAALLLSLAGGWTTWDGMKNFTGEPVLSAMFTFGIHGVMLIVAWLIGESFATGMNQMAGPNRRHVSPPLIALSVLGGGLLLVAFVAALITVGISNNQVLYGLAGAGALVLATVLVLMFSKSDVVQPYAQGLRIVAKNSMLWVMFLACMATSVFFSFDSRFNVIFPKDQRERAAEIRTKGQVAGVVADIGDTIESRRLAEAEHLFQTDGWKAYDEQLAALSKASEGAEQAIEAHFTKQMETYRASIAQQQERIATASSGQAGLASRKATLTDELSRLKADRPGLAAELAGKKTELDNRAKEVDAKRVEAMAEDKGVEGTLKEGKGPVYRQLVGDLGKLKEYYKIGEERVRDAQKRLDQVDGRIAQIERELAGVDGELAKLKGEADTANQRIKVAEESQLGKDGPKADPARVRAAFERARADFRQQPGAETLASLHQYCVQLYDAMASTDATKDRVRNIDCDPKQATEAAAVMFGLNAGLKSYETNCAGGDKVPETGGVDGLLQFGRRCLQDSGLPSKESSEMASKLSFIDLNRDDKAHNFVVSLNAFQDGNRLAYLALAIAIGIDSLIFMAGLFGANAVRSPLSDVPSLKARNSQQLNAMIETALLPDTFRKARLVAQSMHPIENVDGYSNEVRLDELDPETAVQVRDVLNAGSIIGAVKRADAPGRYLVRSELLEFLNMVIKRELETNKEKAQRGLELDQLEDQIAVALMPHVGLTCDVVMQHLDPINETRGFTSEVYLEHVADEMKPAVLNVLNTGATFQVVQRDQKEATRYYVHKDLYKALARIRARELAKGAGALQLGALGSRRAGFGGSLTPHRTALEDLTVQSPALQGGDDARSDFVTSLVEALGMPAEPFLDIPGPAFLAATAASEAFSHARQSNPLLDQELTERDEQARHALERAFARLEASVPSSDEWKHQQLAAAYQELDHNWPVLMLMPNGPYETVLKGVIEQLEPDNGAGTLSAEETVLYNVAKRLVAALSEGDRNSDKTWIRLEAVFHQLARSHPQVAHGDGKRTLN